MKVVVVSMTAELVGPREKAGPHESPITKEAKDSERSVSVIMMQKS